MGGGDGGGGRFPFACGFASSIHHLRRGAMDDTASSLAVSLNAIKPTAQRVDAKGKDTFDLGSFWRENEVGKGIDAFAYVLRAVLANSPNSIPPERVFSILNDTFEDDMERSLADYIELALQLQFNGHSRE